MLVGEQPGDEEDLRGRAFVGPAGQLLNEVIARAGMQRNELFVTNSVKHFKWEPRGKRRLHKRPDTQEVHACRTWLFREIESVTPRVIVALGSTAMRALLGSSAKVQDARQLTHAHPSGAVVVATYHPAAILRTTGDRQRALREALELDLKKAADLARTQG
jgi:DNA polymerase